MTQAPSFLRVFDRIGTPSPALGELTIRLRFKLQRYLAEVIVQEVVDVEVLEVWYISDCTVKP